MAFQTKTSGHYCHLCTKSTNTDTLWSICCVQNTVQTLGTVEGGTYMLTRDLCIVNIHMETQSWLLKRLEPKIQI